jgi:hypothetical protein
MAVKRINHTKPTATISKDLKGGKLYPKGDIPKGARVPLKKKVKVKWDTSLSGAHV